MLESSSSYVPFLTLVLHFVRGSQGEPAGMTCRELWDQYVERRRPRIAACRRVAQFAISMNTEKSLCRCYVARTQLAYYGGVSAESADFWSRVESISDGLFTEVAYKRPNHTQMAHVA